DILESDARSEAVLNYSIYHGRDAEPLPPHAKACLEAWAAAHPGRIFQGYKVLFHAGSGAELEYDRDREADFHGLGRGCVRCFPVLTTKGRFHACPFAAEIAAPHYDLGRVGTEPQVVFRNYRTFRRWVDEVLDPAARARGVTSCQMCHRHLAGCRPRSTSGRDETRAEDASFSFRPPGPMAVLTHAAPGAMVGLNDAGGAAPLEAAEKAGRTC